jgi:hypothetical protein
MASVKLVSKVTNVYIVAMAMVPTGFLVAIFRLATIFTNIPVVKLNYHCYKVSHCSVVFMVKQESQKCFVLSIFSFFFRIIKGFKTLLLKNQHFYWFYPSI